MTNKKELQTAGGMLENDDKYIVNQLLGQVQMAGAFEEFSRTVRTSKLSYVKEHRLYKQLAGQKSPNGSEFKGTWEEFCNLIGMSVDKADLDIKNLHSFGEDALESMSRMGIGYRDLRQYRRLPDDKRAALIEAAETGDKERFVEVAEDVVAGHEKDKAAVIKERDEVKADYEAQSALLKGKAEELDSTKLELEKAKRHLRGLSADGKMKAVREELGNVTYEIESLLAGKFHEGAGVLFNEDPNQHNVFLSALLKTLEVQIIAIRDEYGLSDEISTDGELGWLESLNNGDEEEQLDFIDGDFKPHAVPQKVTDKGA
jgi:hypothetical protein